MRCKRFIASLLIVAALCGTLVAEGPKKLLLLSQGSDGHPSSTHEYIAGCRVLAACLARVPDLEVTQVRADEPWADGPGKIDAADGVFLFLSQGARWASADSDRLAALKRLAARGGGLSGLHWGIGTKDAEPIEAYLQLLGACHGGPDRKYAVIETEVRAPDPRHPIAAGLADLRIKDEFYYQLKFVRPEGSVRPVLTADIDGRPQVVAWSWQRPDGGRSFGFSGMHFHENWRNENYRRLVAQGVLWSLELPIPEKGLDVNVEDQAFSLK